MKEYFLTIRKHNVKDYVSERNISDILVELQRRLSLKIIDVVYEVENKYAQLHCHVIVKTVSSVYYKKHSSINGFRVYWRPVVNRAKVLSYMHKDSCNKYEQEQIIVENYYRHNYGFI